MAAAVSLFVTILRPELQFQPNETIAMFSSQRLEKSLNMLMSWHFRDAFLSRPGLSGFTSTTRRSQVYTSSEYSSPRPGHILRDGSSLSSTGFQKTGKAKRSGFCFWLLVLLLLIGLIVIVIVFWNMDPAFQNPALPDTEAPKHV